jgi:hypothetical protein
VISRRRAALRATLLGAALLGAACGSEDDGTAAATGSSTTATTASTAGQTRFCELLAEADGEVEESYLGSADHRAQLDGLVAAAPEDVRPDLELFRDHVRTSVSASAPGSADIANYPDPVVAAIERVQQHRADRC